MASGVRSSPAVPRPARRTVTPVGVIGNLIGCMRVFTVNIGPETTMLYDHRFAEPSPKRTFGFLGRYWLPLTVVSVAAVLLIAELLGLNPHIVWAGSTMLSGFVMTYTLFVLVRSRRRLDKLNKRIDIAIADASRPDLQIRRTR